VGLSKRVKYQKRPVRRHGTKVTHTGKREKKKGEQSTDAGKPAGGGRTRYKKLSREKLHLEEAGVKKKGSRHLTTQG